MVSRFLKLFVSFYAYNKYSESHCGIYLRLSSPFDLLPELILSEPSETETLIEAAREFYENDLPSPHVADVALPRWKRKWCSSEDADLPTSAAQTLVACDPEFLPNIHTSILNLCTLPIPSAECERSFSTVRRLKTYLRSTMSSKEVINKFAQRQPRRLLNT